VELIVEERKNIGKNRPSIKPDLRGREKKVSEKVIT